MFFSYINQSCDRNEYIFHKKCQTKDLKQLCKVNRFRHLIQFYFVSFIISKVAHANPKCHGTELLENEDMTCDIIRDILDTHNRLRQSIAEGSINAQPPAANMREMYWDSELASGAQNWANQCTFDHNSEKDRKVERFSVGQNLGLMITPGSQYITKIEFSKQINKWFDEHELYQFSAIDAKSAATTGHYTQVVWANTYLVGCGYSMYKTSNNTAYQFYVCNYGPAGNVLDKLPYIIGNRSCDHPLKNSDKYPNLCGVKDVPISCLKNNTEELNSYKRSAFVQNGRKFLNSHHNTHKYNSSVYQRKKSFCSRKMQINFLSRIFCCIIL